MGKHGPKEDLTGRRFGRLLVVEFIETVNKQSWWKCKCDCGNEKTTTVNRLKTGNCRSCGCLVSDYREKVLPENAKRAGQKNITHGGTKTKLFRTWTAMRNRCSNPNNPAYKWYGAKGVKVCDEWDTYEAFRDWSYANGYDDTMVGHKQSIDRIDPNGDYCPENCRWADIETQNENRTCVKTYEYNGDRGTLGYFARKYGFKEDTLRWRVLKMKEPIEVALVRKPWAKQ